MPGLKHKNCQLILGRVNILKVKGNEGILIFAN